MAKLTPYQEAALKDDVHISLTANAGSGKTFVFANRYVDIAVSKCKSLREIVAITFTEKAAGELNHRIARELDSRYESEQDVNKRKKIVSLRRQIVSANISTIHSFCANILRDFSPEAGIDANFTLLDADSTKEIAEKAVDKLYNISFEDEKKAERIKEIVRILGSKKALSSTLLKLKDSRKTAIDLLENLYADTAKAAKYFDELFRSEFTKLFMARIESALNIISDLNVEVLTAKPEHKEAVEVNRFLHEFNKCDSLPEKIKAVKSLFEALLTAKNEFRKNYSKHCSPDVKSEIEITTLAAELSLIDIDEYYNLLNEESGRFGKNFLELFGEFLSVFNVEKHEQGAVDFEDLLLLTRELVKREDVQRYLAQQYRYIMIDEYQDTNEIQYEIFMPVLENLTKGNLFVVGDEKQSIYRFREAELEVFDRTKQEIGDSNTGGSVLNLPHSFRVSPPIALFINQLFRSVFNSPTKDFNEVEHSDLLCAKAPDVKGDVEFLMINKETGINEPVVVAEKIVDLLNLGEYKPSDIAVLSRKRSLFDELEEEFTARAIPYTILGGRGFYQSQLVYDYYNYLSFLVNEANDQALLGVLRSPFYLLSDDIIFNISRQNGSTFFQKLKKYSRQQKLGNVVELLEKHINAAGSMNISSLVKMINLDTEYIAIMSSRFNGKQLVANYRKLLEKAVAYEKEGLKHLYDFIIWLENAINELKDEGMAEAGDNSDAVQIMTIHKSKGLEFDVVFMVGANDRGMKDQVKASDIVVDKKYGVLTKLPVNENYLEEKKAPALAGIFNYVTNKKDEAEQKRLLYVALTRAVSKLYITVKHNNFKADKGTLFGYLQSGFNTDFSGDELVVSDTLEFMKGAEDNFERYAMDMEIEVPIKHVTKRHDKKFEQEVNKHITYEIVTEEILDQPEDEIISATKVAIFNQCPVKYMLTYELGYSGLIEVLKGDRTSEEEEIKEEKREELPADLQGRILHVALEREIKVEEFDKFVESYISAEEEGAEVKENNITQMKTILENFYSSEIWQEIKAYKEYYCEYEIYAKENNYYLYGIIDRLLINGDTAVIVDYKSDNVTEEEITQKAENYIPQLKFYSFLVSKKFNVNNIITKLVFIRHPKKPAVFTQNLNEIADFREKLKSIVKKIRVSDYDKNLSHCNKCHFAVRGKCPIKQG